ncbi:MAG: hypothetical protein ABEJ30_07430 [Halorientalis sp.]
MYRADVVSKSLAVSVATTALIFLVMLSTGLTHAALIAGVGGFNMQAERIASNNTLIYMNSGPVTGSGVPNGQYPLMYLELDSTTITDLRLVKVIEDPLGQGGEAHIIITQEENSTVTTGSLVLRSSSFNASQSIFRGLQIRENASYQADKKFNVSGGVTASNLEHLGYPTEQFVEVDEPAPGTPGIVITDAFIRGHYLVTEGLRVNNLVVGVTYYDSNGNQLTSL